MILAALLLAVAASLALSPGARLGRLAESREVRLRGRPAMVTTGVLGTAVVVTIDGTRLVLAVLVGLALMAGVQQWQRRQRTRAADSRRQAVLAVCESLAADLVAGQPPLTALHRAARDWPDFVPVARAATLGADVPGALRSLARADGAEDLRLLGAAWQVADQSGSGLGAAIARTAEAIASRRRTARLVEAELAAANATARLLAVLPLGVLAMGSGVGGDPWHFLLATSGGLVCLAAGLALSYGGLVWLQRIAAGVV